MTECAHLEAYLDRALDAAHRATFEAHCGGCSRCKTSVESWNRLGTRIIDVVHPAKLPVPSDFKAQRLVKDAQRRFEAPRRTWVRPLLAVAAGLFIAGVWAWQTNLLGLRASPPTGASSPLILSDASGNSQLLPPEQVLGHWVPAPVNESVKMSFGKDSMTLRGGRARLIRADATETRVELGDGRLTLTVEPRAQGQRFVVESGAAQIEVVGTQFRVERRKTSVEVLVLRGRVKVSGPGGPPIEIGRGQRVDIGSQTRTVGSVSEPDLEALFSDSPPATEPAPQPVEAAPLAQEEDDDEPLRREPPRNGRKDDVKYANWRRWVVQGEFARAETALTAHLRRHPKDASAWSLLADARRKAGDWKPAVEAYVRLISVGDAQMANRARLLAASVLQDELGEHRKAVPLLREYLRQGSPVRPLEAAAMVRLARSLRVTGKPKEAATLLRQVLDAHPGTSAAREARQLLEAP